MSPIELANSTAIDDRPVWLLSRPYSTQATTCLLEVDDSLGKVRTSRKNFKLPWTIHRFRHGLISHSSRINDMLYKSLSMFRIFKIFLFVTWPKICSTYRTLISGWFGSSFSLKELIWVNWRIFISNSFLAPHRSNVWKGTQGRQVA